MKDAAQDFAERTFHRTWCRDWPLGLGRRAPSPPRHHHRRRRRLCAARAEMRAQLGSSVAFGSGCGQALPGVPRKAPLCCYSSQYGWNLLPSALSCAERKAPLSRCYSVAASAVSACTLRRPLRLQTKWTNLSFKTNRECWRATQVQHWVELIRGRSQCCACPLGPHSGILSTAPFASARVRPEPATSGGPAPLPPLPPPA